MYKNKNKDKQKGKNYPALQQLKKKILVGCFSSFFP